ncbi:uncharacterized protein KY384_005367 [Bacidia gigantensis]|uniref:uncharacterized protein n=1 Tax=Bacidia gigantensis TaxID=2732470 RepID=UPI001D05A743|nr:uncharacterized protein KY384_005367 [Bacidia gigantensis]KAG8529886.1 hypothetical protein KY384_005367 [Bacidia gigantensis]
MTHELPINSIGTHRHVNGSSRVPQKNGVANGTNGHSTETNGIETSHANGYSPSKLKKRSKDFFGHDREEVTRLLIQGLEDLGYDEAAERLGQESGYQIESPSVAAFRHAVLEDDADPDLIKFLIREQKYVELLKRNSRTQALTVLQTELQPLNYDTRRLNVLSGYMVSDPSGDLTWTTILDGRQKLLSELSKFVSPSAMIPQHRLAGLLDQVHRGQISQCLYHNPISSRPTSLFTDHKCDQNEFPLRSPIELTQSDGEVWYVEFSHNGKFLAACGQSRTVVVYDTHTFDVRHKLSEHSDNVLYLSWSPNDSKLITCGRDAKARMWDMISGRCILIVDHQEQGVSSAAWTPDGNYFVTGALDKHAQLCLRPADGRGEPFNWPTALRTQDCAITPNGQKLVVMSTENYITVYDIPSRREEYSIKVAHRMTCISVSRDSRTMLVNMANDEVHLIDIESADIVRKYFGQEQGGFIIRSAFGGADEGLVISGSANSKVYIWHKENGTLIETLAGHAYGCVNAVSWNFANPTMFASGGDDKKVRIWTKDPKPSSLLRRRVSSQSSHRHTY